MSASTESSNLSPQLLAQLRTLEDMTELMYTSVDQVSLFVAAEKSVLYHYYILQEERKNAQDSLRAFTCSRECIPQCRLILNHSTVSDN